MSSYHRGIRETEVIDEEDDAEMTKVEWEPPNRTATGPRENAILALQAAAVAAQNFNSHFSARDDEREASIPLFWGDEMVLGREPLRNWGYFVEYELKAVRLLQEDGEEPDEEHEEARSRVMQRSIDGHYSIKLMQPGLMDLDYGIWAAEDFMTETRLLMNLPPHRNVSQIYGLNKGGIDTLLESGRRGFFIITDRVRETLPERLSAWKAKKGYRNPSTPSQTIRRFAQRIEVALDIAAALKFLHETKLVYHVRPDKIGFDAKGDVKLFQFGQVRQEGSQQAQARSLTNSEDMNVLRYIAPEVLCKAPATTGSDVYSFGILLWEIMSLKTPYGGWDRATHLERCVQNHGRPPMNRQWPSACHELLQGTWDPHLRLTMRKVKDKLSDVLMIEESTCSSHNPRSSGQSSRPGDSGHQRAEASGHRRREVSGHRREGSQRKSRATTVAAPNVSEEVLPTPQEEEPDNPNTTDVEDKPSTHDSPASENIPKLEGTPVSVPAVVPLPPLSPKQEIPSVSTPAVAIMPPVSSKEESPSISTSVVVPLPPLSPKQESPSVSSPVVVLLPPVSQKEDTDEEGKVTKCDTTIVDDATAGNMAAAPVSLTDQRRQQSFSPPRQNENSPRRNLGDVPHKRTQRRASVHLTTGQERERPTKATASPMPKPGSVRAMHRSASMSHVGKNPDVVVLPPTPLEETRVPQNEDYEDDFEHGEDEKDQGKKFYGYAASPVKSKAKSNDNEKSTSSSRNTDQSPLRRRLGGAASALIGGIASTLRRPNSSRNSCGTPDSPSKRPSLVSPKSESHRKEKGFDESMSSLTSSPKHTANDSIPNLTTPKREPKESVTSVLSTPHHEPKHSVSAEITPLQEPKDSMSVESTPQRRERKESISGPKHKKKESTSGSTRDKKESSSSRKNRPNSGSSRRSESSTTPGIEKQKSDAGSSVTWRRQRSARCVGTTSPRKASMGRLKSSRILTSNVQSSRTESIKEELMVTILSDEEESDHPSSPRKDRTSGENVGDENVTIAEDSTASGPRVGLQSGGGNDNSMRRRRAAQGHSTHRRPVNNQEASTDLPEVPPTPSARVRQRRRGSTGGAVPMMGTPGESQTSAFLEELQRRAKLANQSGGGKSGHNRETEASGHRRSRQERSGHSRPSADEGWMQDIVKPFNEANPDISTGTGTGTTPCSSTIDSSRIDRLINLDQEEYTNEEVPLDPVTPRRRMARLSSVTQLFRKGGNGEGKDTEATQEAAQTPVPKLMSRFMKNDTLGKQPATNDESKNKVVPGLVKKNRRASVG